MHSAIEPLSDNLMMCIMRSVPSSTTSRAGLMSIMTITELIDQFAIHTRGWNWEVEGFLDKTGHVHPIDTDTKVISTVFERLTSPVLRTIAKQRGYIVETANQTTYPDFTLTLKTGDLVEHRIAIDVKTTYKSNSMGMTLGGYNSFLRNGTKNILYPYETYSEHWILGFIYQQNPAFEEYDLESLPTRGKIQCAYRDVFMFIREKAAISGLRAGSGNTKNIGSIRLSRPEDFATAIGPFLQFSRYKQACDHYWRNYEDYCPSIATPAQLREHPDFEQFL